MLYNIGLYQPCCCWEFSFASCTKDYSAGLVFRRSFIIILLNSCLKQLLLHSRVFIWVSGEPYLDNFGCVTVTWCRVLLEKLSSGLQRTVTACIPVRKCTFVHLLFHFFGTKCKDHCPVAILLLLYVAVFTQNV